MVRTLVPRRICAGAGWRNHRLRYVRVDWKFADSDRLVVRRRLLGSGGVHNADDNDHHQRLRPRYRAAGVYGDSPDGRDSSNPKERRSVRRVIFDAFVADIVELQSHLQRPTRA